MTTHNTDLLNGPMVLQDSSNSACRADIGVLNPVELVCC